MVRQFLLISTLLILASPLLSQDKLVIDDRAGILSATLEKALMNRLSGEGLSYTTMVDFRDACAYYYGGLENRDGDLILRIRDCNDIEIGSKNLGASIGSASSEEQGMILSFAIRDMVSQPGKYTMAGAAPSAAPSAEMGEEVGGAGAKTAPDTLSNEHNSRYFFSPSAFNLKKQELYYNTVYFFLHDLQYGINDNFSMGFGTSIIGLPFYLTPKVSIPLGEKSALAFGDLLMLGTWGTDFMGNLAYGVFTRGSMNGNFTIGAGHLWTNDNEITNNTSSLVLNFSAMGRMSPYLFLMSENYLMSAVFDRTASFYGSTGYIEESFNQRNYFWYGILGIRMISKNRSFIAWQFGLTYIVNYSGDYIDQNDMVVNNKYESWDLSSRTRKPGDINLFAVPTVTFTVKFGAR